MKTLILTGALAFASMLTYADPTPASSFTNYRASENLKSMFGNVRNVSWQPAMNNMIRANFTSFEENISVFFNAEGEYLATTREIMVGDLPAKLRTAIEKKFEGIPLEQVFELTSDSEHGWYFQTTNAKGKKKVWKGYENGRIDDFSFNL